MLRAPDADDEMRRDVTLWQLRDETWCQPVTFVYRSQYRSLTPCWRHLEAGKHINIERRVINITLTPHSRMDTWLGDLTWNNRTISMLSRRKRSEAWNTHVYSIYFQFSIFTCCWCLRTRLIYAEILEANIEFGCGKCWEKSNIDTFAILQIEYLTVPSFYVRNGRRRKPKIIHNLF